MKGIWNGRTPPLACRSTVAPISAVWTAGRSAAKVSHKLSGVDRELHADSAHAALETLDEKWGKRLPVPEAGS